MACQLRLSTSTVALVNMFIKCYHAATAHNHRPWAVRCLFFVEIGRITLAAAAGNAPALPVSETGVQTSTLSGKMTCQAVAGRRRLVAREGAAPPISGCRPDVILFHHRAENGCRGWTRTTTLAFKGRCPAIRRPGKQVVEPEVVATSPNRIKSPVPVCCGFGSRKNGGRERTCTSKAHRFSICGVCYSL